MSAKKLTTFGSKSVNKSVISAIRFSTLDDDDTDTLIPPGSNSELSLEKPSVSEETVPIATTQPVAVRSEMSSSASDTHTCISLVPCGYSPSTDQVTVIPSTSSDRDQTGAVSRITDSVDVRVSDDKTATPSKSASEVAASDIHALLDSFSIDPCKRERRKPSEVVKSKSTFPASKSKDLTNGRKKPAPTLSDIDSIFNPVTEFSNSAPQPEEPNDPAATDTIHIEECPEEPTLEVGASSAQLKHRAKSSDSATAADPAVDNVPVEGGEAMLPVGEKTTAATGKTLLQQMRATISRQWSSTDSRRQLVTDGEVSSLKKPWVQFLLGTLMICLLIYLALSWFVWGFLVGAGLTFLACRFYYSLYLPLEPEERAGIRSLRDIPPVSAPQGLEDQPRPGERRIFRGWMNEVNTYNPDTYNINRTFSIHVTLEGSQLRLQRPKKTIPRRAMWNEEVPAASGVTFVHQRIFDILHARITLMPSGLVAKRIWSKKYPICLTMKVDPDNKSSIRSGIKTRSTGGFVVIGSEDLQTHSIFLFSRTGRDKEDWFRRFYAASLGVPLSLTPQAVMQQYLQHGPSAAASGLPTAGSSDLSADGTTADNPLLKSTPSRTPSIPPVLREPHFVAYIRYMAKYVPHDLIGRNPGSLHTGADKSDVDTQAAWMNAVLGRVFWDFFRENYWLSKVREKIQRKLKTIRLPTVIDELTVTDIDVGQQLPVIRRVGRPYIDHQGLWIDLDIAYSGGFSMNLETKLNLMRLRDQQRPTQQQQPSDGGGNSDQLAPGRTSTVSTNLASLLSQPSASTTAIGVGSSLRCPRISSNPELNTTDAMQGLPELGSTEVPFSSTNKPSQACSSNLIGQSTPIGSHKLAAYVSDEEDSAEYSTDDDQDIDSDLSAGKLPDEQDGRSDQGAGSLLASGSAGSSTKSSGRILQFVNRIAKSSYFQKAVDNKYLQRGMEYVSNTPIMLQVQVHKLNGVLAVNIPPPPSDRVWYGFRVNPQLSLSAKPRVGEKAVTMTRINEWIEKKLALEFQRFVVLPNMDDFVIPLLISGSPDKLGQSLH